MHMAKDRETRIPEDIDLQPPGWELNGDPIQVPEADQDALWQAVADAVTILRHIGGTVTVAPVRIELGPDVYKTVEYVFRWNSFVPPAREAQAEPVEEEKPALAAVGD